jgi:hypothetical protein
MMGLSGKLWEKRPASVFGVFFSIFVVMALLSTLGERVRLARRASSD